MPPAGGAPHPLRYTQHLLLGGEGFWQQPPKGFPFDRGSCHEVTDEVERKDWTHAPFACLWAGHLIRHSFQLCHLPLQEGKAFDSDRASLPSEKGEVVAKQPERIIGFLVGYLIPSVTAFSCDSSPYPLRGAFHLIRFAALSTFSYQRRRLSDFGLSTNLGLRTQDFQLTQDFGLARALFPVPREPSCAIIILCYNGNTGKKVCRGLTGCRPAVKGDQHGTA